MIPILLCFLTSVPKDLLWIPVWFQIAHWLSITDKLFYHGVYSAQGTIILSARLYPVEFHGPGIECQQTVGQKFSRSGQIF